jgi:hypothetical protein
VKETLGGWVQGHHVQFSLISALRSTTDRDRDSNKIAIMLEPFSNELFQVVHAIARFSAE